MRPAESRQEESSQRSWDVVRSRCHETPVVETPVFFWRSHGDYYQFGRTWICMKAMRGQKGFIVDCHKPSPRYNNTENTLFCKTTPKGFTQETWNSLKAAGPGYLDEWGYWLIEKDGKLVPYPFPGSRVEEVQKKPRQLTIPSHGLIRKEELAGSAYQKETIEDVPF